MSLEVCMLYYIVPGNRAAITLATTRFLHTCTMTPRKICSSQALENGQFGGVSTLSST